MFSRNLVIAHRGACTYAPENTLAAMRKARDLGVHCIEFDVMLSKDGVPIVFHDERLEEKSNGVGLVCENIFSQISKLDAGSWFHPSFSKERISSFKEILEFLAGENIGINVEIKPAPGQEKRAALAVFYTLKNHWKRNDNLVVSSFSIECLYEIEQLDKNIQLAYLLDDWNLDWQEQGEKMRFFSLNVNYEALNPKRIASIKHFGIRVWAYTVNELILAKKLFALGVDGIITDQPDALLSFFSNKDT